MRVLILLLFLMTFIHADESESIKITVRYKGKVYSDLPVEVLDYSPLKGVRIRVIENNKEVVILNKDIHKDSRVILNEWNEERLKKEKLAAQKKAHRKAVDKKLNPITLGLGLLYNQPQIISVTNDGLLISYKDPNDNILIFVKTNPEGHADGEYLEGDLYKIGKHTYTTVTGARRTIRKYTSSQAEALKMVGSELKPYRKESISRAIDLFGNFYKFYPTKISQVLKDGVLLMHENRMIFIVTNTKNYVDGDKIGTWKKDMELEPLQQTFKYRSVSGADKVVRKYKIKYSDK